MAQPEETDLATRIIADIEVARAVASHRALFFSEQDASGRGIDYAATVAGGLRLVPEGAARELQDNDYQRMAQDGLLLDGAESFHVLMSRCWCIGLEANEATSRRHT